MRNPPAHPFYRGNVGASCQNKGILISSYEKEDELILLISNPSQNGLKNVVINCDFAAECELVGAEFDMKYGVWMITFRNKNAENMTHKVAVSHEGKVFLDYESLT